VFLPNPLLTTLPTKTKTARFKVFKIKKFSKLERGKKRIFGRRAVMVVMVVIAETPILRALLTTLTTMTTNK
jgi:hypothetical protein